MGTATRNRTHARLQVLRELQSYFEAGQSVCPFARSRKALYATERGLLRALTDFIGFDGALVVGAETEPGNMPELQPWARRLFYEIANEAHKISFPPHTAESRLEAKLALDTLFADDSGRNPFIALAGRAMVTIAMSPLYPRRHPRYAPRTCLVITWHAEVLPFIGTKASDLVRAQMLEAHGYLYNADELVVPWPPNGKVPPPDRV